MFEHVSRCLVYVNQMLANLEVLQVPRWPLLAGFRTIHRSVTSVLSCGLRQVLRGRDKKVERGSRMEPRRSAWVESTHGLLGARLWHSPKHHNHL